MRFFACFVLAAVAASFAGAGEPENVDPGVIAGRVTDLQGTPIDGADVRLTRLDRDLGPLSYSSMRSTLTQKDGSFRFEKVATSTWLLDARDHERYLASPIRLVITPARLVVESASLALTPASAVEGVVCDEQGRPLQGVGVAVGDGGLQGKTVTPVVMTDYDTGLAMKLPEGASYPRLPLKLALTDEHGKFRLCPVLPEIATSLRVGGLAAYHDTTVSGIFAPAGGTALVEVTLHRGAAITGRVLRPDGRPAANTRVSLLLLETQPKHDSWIVLPRATEAQGYGVEARWLITGQEGLFRFEGLNAAHYLIVAESEGFARATSSILAILRDGEFLPAEISLAEGHAIHGRIADPDGFGIDGVAVEVVKTRDTHDSRSGIDPYLAPVRATPDENGSFVLRMPEPSVVDLHVTCPGLPVLVVPRVFVGSSDEIVVTRTRHQLKLESKADDGVASARK